MINLRWKHENERKYHYKVHHTQPSCAFTWSKQTSWDWRWSMVHEWSLARKECCFRWLPQNLCWVSYHSKNEQKPNPWKPHPRYSTKPVLQETTTTEPHLLHLTQLPMLDSNPFHHEFPLNSPLPLLHSFPPSNIQNSKLTLFSFLLHPPIFPQSPEQVDLVDSSEPEDNSSSLVFAVSSSLVPGDVTSRLRNLDEQTLDGVFLLMSLIGLFLLLVVLAEIWENAVSCCLGMEKGGEGWITVGAWWDIWWIEYEL